MPSVSDDDPLCDNSMERYDIDIMSQSCFFLYTENIIGKRQASEDDEIPPYLEILRGRDGQQGAQGSPGKDGIDGEKGMKGESGQQGGVGIRGPVGPAGEKGDDGVQGLPGNVGLTGPQGPSGRSSGVTYVRWGRTTCAGTPGTELVYTGRAAGTYYDTTGGTNDYLCFPEQPEYLAYTPGVQAESPIHGSEYQINGGPLPLQNQNVPCVVCNTELRGSLLMIPARVSCPASWTMEYSGYLMTGRAQYSRRSAACVDKDAEGIPGLDADSDGAPFYHTEVVCNGINCPPYDPEKELTCVVCTK